MAGSAGHDEQMPDQMAVAQAVIGHEEDDAGGVGNTARDQLV